MQYTELMCNITIIRPHRICVAYRCDLLLAMFMVCDSVRLSVGHADVLWQNGWADRDAVWRVGWGGRQYARVCWPIGPNISHSSETVNNLSSVVWFRSNADGMSVLHEDRKVGHHFALSQLQCQVIKRPTNWTYSLPIFNVVESLSQ